MRQHRFRRWLRDLINNFDSDVVEQSKLTVSRADDGPDHDKCLNFRVWFANGGKVIQTNKYDRLKDRSTTSMYVITEEQELGRELDKIITMESLRG